MKRTPKTLKLYPWVFKALDRDNNQCVDCGEKEKQIIVHHIDESRKTGILNNNLDNLVSVCRLCHSRRHGMCSNHEDILEMRESGMTYREIAKKFGTSHQYAQQVYRKYQTKEKQAERLKRMGDCSLGENPNIIKVELPEKDKKQFKIWCKKNGYSMAGLIRKLIKKEINVT